MIKLSQCMLLLAVALGAEAKPIRVAVWDEQQPAQKKAYTNFLGNQIAQHLRTFPNLEVKSVSLNDPDQGLSVAVLDNCDVLIWWGHVRHTAISNEKAKELVRRIREGKLSLIALHSAHWSEPFVEAMNERTRADAVKAAGTEAANFEFIAPARFQPPKADAPLTPRVEKADAADGRKILRVMLAQLLFSGLPAGWRAQPRHNSPAAASHRAWDSAPFRYPAN